MVIGTPGLVAGAVVTPDAVISGRVEGKVVAASRLELDSEEGQARLGELSEKYEPECLAEGQKVKELGGQVIVEPMDVPGGDRVAMCMDPAGAAFAVHSTGTA